MITIATILIIGYLFYILFIKGVGFAIALFAGSVIGLSLLIDKYFPQTHSTFAVVLNYNISYAILCAFIISVVGCGYLINEK